MPSALHIELYSLHCSLISERVLLSSFFGGSQASSACPLVKIKMNMEHWFNTDKEKPKKWDEKRSQCHFVSQMLPDWPAIEPRL